MAAAFSVFTNALLRGLAQLAFCDTIRAGGLLLAGLALFSPWSAVGALSGAVFGTAAGYLVSAYSREQWSCGLAGFNTAIVGIFWGGFFASGAFNLPLFLTVLSVCAALEYVLSKTLALVSLPALSMPAVATVILASWVLAAPGTWFWADTVASPFGTTGILVALLCFVAAMVTRSALAAGWTVCLAAVAYLAIWSQGSDPLAYAGLWAVTVPLACFAMQTVFLRESLAGAVGGTIAALSAAGIWVLWMSSGMVDTTPPLLAPFILGVWLAIAAMRRIGTSPFLQPSFWRTAAAIHRANLTGDPVVALSGGDAARYALASAYLSGGPRDGQTRKYALSDERLRNSLRCRKAMWDVCGRLRNMAEDMQATAFHRAIADFERRGWLQATISQDVFGHPGDAGVRSVVELYGRIDQITCLDCGFSSDWPPGEIWKHCDLRCSKCTGVLKPATSLFSNDLTSSVTKAIESHLADDAVLLVLGEQIGDARVDFIPERVHAGRGRVVFVTDGALSHTLRSDDMVIAARTETTIPRLAIVLSALRLLSGVYPPGWRHRWPTGGSSIPGTGSA